MKKQKKKPIKSYRNTPSFGKFNFNTKRKKKG